MTRTARDAGLSSIPDGNDWTSPRRHKDQRRKPAPTGRVDPPPTAGDARNPRLSNDPCHIEKRAGHNGRCSGSTAYRPEKSGMLETGSWQHSLLIELPP